MGEIGRRVLVVDDEQAIRRYLKASLNAHGYIVSEAAFGVEALNSVVKEQPDVIILDLGLPDMDGIEVTRRLREWSSIPIVILSVREHEKDKIAALDAGADDYLTKPFGTGELMARMRSAIRRATVKDGEPVFTLEELQVDFASRIVTLRGEEVLLTPTEYEILRALVRNVGKVMTHQQLLRQIRGGSYEDAMHLLRVNISNLRKKIEPDPSRPHYIITEPGVGYRLRAES